MIDGSIVKFSHLMVPVERRCNIDSSDPIQVDRNEEQSPLGDPRPAQHFPQNGEWSWESTQTPLRTFQKDYDKLC